MVVKIWVKSIELLEEAVNSSSSLLSAFLRWTRGEYGAKKSEPETAIGQFPGGQLSGADARQTPHAPKRRSVGDKLPVRR